MFLERFFNQATVFTKKLLFLSVFHLVKHTQNGRDVHGSAKRYMILTYTFSLDSTNAVDGKPDKPTASEYSAGKVDLNFITYVN